MLDQDIQRLENQFPAVSGSMGLSSTEMSPGDGLIDPRGVGSQPSAGRGAVEDRAVPMAGVLSPQRTSTQSAVWMASTTRTDYLPARATNSSTVSPLGACKPMPL